MDNINEAAAKIFSRRGFEILLSKLPDLIDCEANHKALLDAFRGIPVLTPDVAIQIINENLRGSLAWRNRQQEFQQSQDNLRKLARDKSPEAKEELKTIVREENPRRVPAAPPPELTRTAYKNASVGQCRQWARQYGLRTLELHWRQQEAR